MRRLLTALALHWGIVRVVRVEFASATGNVATLVTEVVFGVCLGFFRMLPVFVACARSADAFGCGMFLRHVTDPADNPGCGCSGKCCPDGPARANCPAPAWLRICRSQPTALCRAGGFSLPGEPAAVCGPW